MMVILTSSVTLVYGEVFDKKKCIADIPKNIGVALTNKMRKDCENKETGIDIDKNLKKEANIKNSKFEKNKYEKSIGSSNYGVDHKKLKQELYEKARKKPAELDQKHIDMKKYAERINKLQKELERVKKS